MRLSINRLSSDPCDLIGFSSAEVDGRKSLCSSPRREILVCATMAPLWTRHRDPGKGKWREGSSLRGNLQSAPTSSLPPHVDFLGRCTQEGLEQCPAGRVFQYRVGSGRVLDKIPGSGSGSGRVGVLKYTIRYFRVSFLLSGISRYFRYFWVFLGLPIYTMVIL